MKLKAFAAKIAAKYGVNLNDVEHAKLTLPPVKDEDCTDIEHDYRLLHRSAVMSQFACMQNYAYRGDGNAKFRDIEELTQGKFDSNQLIMDNLYADLEDYFTECIAEEITTDGSKNKKSIQSVLNWMEKNILKTRVIQKRGDPEFVNRCAREHAAKIMDRGIIRYDGSFSFPEFNLEGAIAFSENIKEVIVSFSPVIGNLNFAHLFHDNHLAVKNTTMPFSFDLSAAVAKSAANTVEKHPQFKDCKTVLTGHSRGATLCAYAGTQVPQNVVIVAIAPFKFSKLIRNQAIAGIKQKRDVEFYQKNAVQIFFEDDHINEAFNHKKYAAFVTPFIESDYKDMPIRTVTLPSEFKGASVHNEATKILKEYALDLGRSELRAKNKAEEQASQLDMLDDFDHEAHDTPRSDDFNDDTTDMEHEAEQSFRRRELLKNKRPAEILI